MNSVGRAQEGTNRQDAYIDARALTASFGSLGVVASDVRLPTDQEVCDPKAMTSCRSD